MANKPIPTKLSRLRTEGEVMEDIAACPFDDPETLLRLCGELDNIQAAYIVMGEVEPMLVESVYAFEDVRLEDAAYIHWSQEYIEGKGTN